MGLFSSTPRNRRRRSRRGNDTSWIDQPAEAAAPAPARRRGKAGSPTIHEEKVHTLHAQIGAIESFLAKHHYVESMKQQMRKENILPPPDRSSHRRAHRSMSLAAKRRHNAERNRTSFRFLVLFCTACGLAWWLLFSGV